MTRSVNDRRGEVLAAMPPGQFITHNELVDKLEKAGKSDCIQEIFAMWTEKLIEPQLAIPNGQIAPVLAYKRGV